MDEDKNPTLQERSRDPVLMTWYRFIRVLRKVTNRMDEAFQPLDISRSQIDLLLQIAFEDGINQQTCADRMNVTKGNIAQHIARLEQQGLVRRQKEGRTNKLYLTESGQAVIAQIMPVHDRQVRAILAALSAEEVQQFQALLRKLDRNLP